MTLQQNADALTLSAQVDGFETRSFESADPSDDGVSDPGSKRLFDIVGAAMALMLFAPLLLAIYVGLLLTGGKPIFAQSRVGRHGRMFRCYKFRSMSNDANRLLTDYLATNPQALEEWNRAFKLVHDPRVTWLGRFLRRSSMDELPQLFNVLKGDMSLVGPRPIITSEIERYENKIYAYYRCRPGMTGLWQVSGRNLLSYEKRVELDDFYASNRSSALDFIILFRTVGTVVSGRGAC